MTDTETKTKSAKAIERDKQKLKKFLAGVIPEHWDKYDLDAKYDSTLSYMENKNAIIDDLKEVYSDEFRGETLEEQKAYVEAEMEKQQRERDSEIESEIEQYNQKDFTENTELNQYYAPIHRAINKLCSGYSHLAFIKGRGAIGKSWNIKKILVQNKAKFHEICGDVSEAYLYRMFFEHNGEIIWFKDVVRILRGLNSINLLKSAAETEEKRLLTKSNYSKQQADLPDRFLFTGKIIFDYNEINGMVLEDDFNALQTRGDFIEVSFSTEDMQNMMRLIAKTEKQKEVTDFLIKNYSYVGTNLLNLRSQWKAFKTRDYADKYGLDWKAELKAEMDSAISPVKSMLYALMGKKAIRTSELKKLLLQSKAAGSEATAHRRIKEWLITEDLYRVSAEKINFYVALEPIKLDAMQKYNEE
jgi:hypothetical protein